MPFNESMEDYESEVSVIDVYDIASEIGKEFEKIIDCYGSEAVTGLMPKVITALEHLEVLATKNERENSNVQDLEAKILKLESDKLEKAEDRLRYERELELIEEHWKKETQDLESVVNTLQDENRKLKNALAAKQDLPAQQMAPEVDIAALQRLRGMVDQLRDNLRKADREISSKNSEIDELSSQVKRMTNLKKEMSRKQRLMQFQVRGLVDERADFLAQIQDLSHANIALREQLGEAVQENALLFNACKDNCTEAQEDPNRPRFTTAELKEILHERNNLKARVSDLEDELETFRPKQEPESPLDEDSTVQGPLPYEPDDAPWKKSDSGIRKFFRKLFSESNITFLGSSPKRSLSSLSKIALAGSSSVEAVV
ncbi:RILP-like protein homolog isoform X2 [Homalodisca vitripennis]|uniref:RILP-like protein homolog isoform X2 n=1 Tax=Homalodisca vitripennis TaxID=197043 RepID=UPI001EEB1E45|nr:RILP-like protein homolog isoform X2 [Homalodisca vitripennis]